MIPDDHDFSWIAERVTRHYHATAIYLFGSYAKGTSRHDSDIDLLIIGPSRLPPERRGKAVASVLGAFPARFDLLFHTEEELVEACADPRSFLSTVMARARLLYPSAPAPPAIGPGRTAGHG